MCSQPVPRAWNGDAIRIKLVLGVLEAFLDVLMYAAVVGADTHHLEQQRRCQRLLRALVFFLPLLPSAPNASI